MAHTYNSEMAYKETLRRLLTQIFDVAVTFSV